MHTIAPNEFHVLNDRFVIKTRCPKSELKKEMILNRVRAANLQPGDEFTVLVMNHEYTTVFSKGHFVVTHCSENVSRANIGERNERTVHETVYDIAQEGGWLDFQKKLSVKWNPGVKKHQVVSGQDVLFESDDKAEVEAYLRDAA